jgi:hypothetical protein
VIYAGDRSGVIYPILVVACIFLYPLAAVVVVLVSFVHTCMVVRDHNQLRVGPPQLVFRPQYYLAEGNDAGAVTLRIPDRERGAPSSCQKCGHRINENAIYCPGSGVEIGLDSEKTRTFR